MSTNVTSCVEVGVAATAIDAIDNTVGVSASNCSVEIGNADTVVEGYKNEYSIVGDGLYASISDEEAPTWLTSIIDTVVDYAIAGNLTNYTLLIQDIRDAISMLDIAANSYVEKINFAASVDEIIATHLTTFNATLGNTYATLVGLNTMVADINYAMGTQIEDLKAAYTAYINSEITSIRIAYSDADSALASDITALTSVFESQESNISGLSDAVESIQTYVGLTDGRADGTGLLAGLELVRNQLDGVIEYYFFETYNENSTAWPAVNLAIAANEVEALNIIAAAWTTPALQQDAHGNIVYFKDSTNAYCYNSSTTTWETVSDTTIYTAVQNAATAQAAADGKVSQFYAWGGTNAPANYTSTDGTTVSGNSFRYWFKSNNRLYYLSGTSWVLVPTSSSTGGVYVSEGDILTVFNPTTRDLTVYTFNGTSWYQTGTDGIIAKSAWAIDLENEVTGETGHVALALSNLKTTSEAYADNLGASVENKFAYDSTIMLNGVYYASGFGLTSTGRTSGAGTKSDPFNSEFWINAEKLKFTNANKTGRTAPFTIDASGPTPQITFNGVVNFTNTDMSAYANSNIDVSGDINSNNDVMAQKLGYNNYAHMVSQAAAGKTVVRGGYLNADVIAANTAITSPAISGGSITGTTFNNGNGTFTVDANGGVTARNLVIKNSAGQTILSSGTGAEWKYVNGRPTSLATLNPTDGSTLSTAASDASSAFAMASSVIDDISDMNSDNYLTNSEKKVMRNIWNDLYTAYTQTRTVAASYGPTFSNTYGYSEATLDGHYTTLSNYLYNTALIHSTATTQINGATLTNYFNNLSGYINRTNAWLSSFVPNPGNKITNSNISTYIANLAVDTLRIKGNSVTVPAYSSGEYSASATIFLSEAGNVTAIATFTQGLGKDAHAWRLYIDGTPIQTETPRVATTGALSGTKYCSSGSVTVLVFCDEKTGHGWCGITALGTMR